jgi:hypothetical protein
MLRLIASHPISPSLNHNQSCLAFVDIRYLEQQDLADTGIIPAREARDRLYKLFKGGWVDCLELAARPDFNPSSIRYFWKVDNLAVYKQVVDHIYKTMLNLRLRCVCAICGHIVSNIGY